MRYVKSLCLTRAQQLQRLRVNARIAGRDDCAALGCVAAVPRGDDAARALNNGNQRHNIVRLQAGFDNQIGLAQGQLAIGVTIAAITRQPDFLLHPGVGGAQGRGNQQRACGEQGGLT